MGERHNMIGWQCSNKFCRSGRMSKGVKLQIDGKPWPGIRPFSSGHTSCSKCGAKFEEVDEFHKPLASTFLQRVLGRLKI